ncbi:MAG TPA: peptidylprolyl isomerase [Deinococcales bacterium]|nr:peptidylprolyl isomerase [Deinococcales bacterium]
MKVVNNKVVSIEYTLTVDGDVVDSTSGGEPVTFLQGQGNILPGLERALNGLSAGESIHVRIAPEEGYGERDDDQVQKLDASVFPEGAEAGMTYMAESEDGDELPLTVLSVDGDTVTVDFNHPLAGKELDFDVKVLDVRDATPEELAHGHVHGPHGHAHDVED